MALSRFVLLSTVTLAADVVTPIAGNQFGAVGSTEAAGHWGPGAVFPAGTAIMADSSVGTTGPQLLYVAIGAGNLRPYVQGQDDVGHAALAN